MDADKLAVNDRWLKATLSRIAKDGFWMWIDEKEIYYRDGDDVRFTASTLKGLRQLKKVVSTSCFNENVNPLPKKYVKK